VPDGWIGDPDGDGITCGECATAEEIEDWMRGIATIEDGLAEGEL
jgi:hypothetical protein